MPHETKKFSGWQPRKAVVWNLTECHLKKHHARELRGKELKRKKGSRGKIVGVVPGRLILEGWVPETEGPKMPHSSQAAGIRPASACLPEEWGACLGRGTGGARGGLAPLLLTTLLGPRRSKSHLLPGLTPSPKTNITAPAGWCLKFL